MSLAVLPLLSPNFSEASAGWVDKHRSAVFTELAVSSSVKSPIVWHALSLTWTHEEGGITCSGTITCSLDPLSFFKGFVAVHTDFLLSSPGEEMDTFLVVFGYGGGGLYGIVLRVPFMSTSFSEDALGANANGTLLTFVGLEPFTLFNLRFETLKPISWVGGSLFCMVALFVLDFRESSPGVSGSSGLKLWTLRSSSSVSLDFFSSAYRYKTIVYNTTFLVKPGTIEQGLKRRFCNEIFHTLSSSSSCLSCLSFLKMLRNIPVHIPAIRRQPKKAMMTMSVVKPVF